MNLRRRVQDERASVTGQQPGNDGAPLPAGRDANLHGMHGELLLSPAI